MTASHRAYTGARVFDGERVFDSHAVVVDGGLVDGIVDARDVPSGIDVVELDGGLLSPGFIDLQVNGGGGVMLNDAPNATTLRRMAQAHGSLGVTSFLPTLITDTPEQIRAAIEAVETGGVPGVVGLHLEGPHLDPAKKGAHSAALIRPMSDADLALYQEAAQCLPYLMLTLAPEAVTKAQIAALVEAGVRVSLGHSNASFADGQAAIAAGASMVTHLFNAMSQLGSREPGLVGAAFASGAVSAGLIADGVHVHPANVRAALAAKSGPGQVFLVSDAMAVAGTDVTSFTLNDRTIQRQDNRLTLEDGTLAGADLDLLTAVRNIVDWKAAPLEQSLAMATSIPGDLLPQSPGRIRPCASADMIHLTSDLTEIQGVWRAGRALD
ncbi:N-acetylglucosamine-6-phosphate deacetylase [Gymnodinialimonas ulvae]|uniref:N-acetylglucosamine-6-phosphate deacetylase n=1 Tax=Gymnodinialimonas ulvae TaxID=3126504 RepID=UPI0030ADDA74